MYPSGPWKGFWQQELWGRQPMERFELAFLPTGDVRGQGADVIGAFAFTGRFDPTTGEMRMTKRYVGKHTVEYVGRGDGEGRIVGTWNISDVWKGPFSMNPVVRGDEPIEEIVR